MIESAASVMDIFYVGDVPPLRAGSAISAFQILNGLARRGHRVRAVGPITRETYAEGVALVRDQLVETYWFEMPDFAWIRDPLPPAETIQLERQGFRRIAAPLLAARRPDVLINSHEYWSQTIVTLVREFDLPSIQLVRGNPGRGIVEGTFPQDDAERVLAAMRQAEIVVAVADYLAEGLRWLGLAQSISIPNAVDTEHFRPRPKRPALANLLGIEEVDTVVAHFSNLKPIKRALDVVESAALVLQRCPDVVYLIVGEGLQRPEMEARCAHLGIAHRFRFTGWVDHDLVPDYMNLADIVVMTSSGEGMSRVYLEAQACGRVLLSSDIPPARQVAQDGKAGLLFATGDPSDLAEKTIMAVSNPDLRAVMGATARQRIESHHTLDKAVNSYERVLLDAIARHPRSQAGAIRACEPGTLLSGHAPAGSGGVEL